ncbi:MAG: hypothetical protein NTY24_08945, partial [Mycobacterium sp.]|nr:hypothetical protein [Mycobacterium sp.]
MVSVLLCACAAWDTSTPSTPPPRAEGPVPSHVAPEANDVPLPPLPPLPEPPSVEIKVAIASVQLLEDCPEPAPAARQSPGAASLPGPSAGPAERSQQEGDSAFAGDCIPSTVQLSIRSDVLGPFRVEAVR